MNTGRRLLLGLFCMALLFAGGGEFRDINLRMFVLAIGVDHIPDQPGQDRYTFKIAIPSGDPKSGEQMSLLITQDSTSIVKAVRQLKSKVDKELDFGQCKAIVYGYDYARQGIEKMQDWSIRRRDIQMILFPAVGKPTAEAVLRVQSPSERIAGNALFLALSEEGTESPYIAKVFSFDLARRMREKGLDPYMPVIEAEGGTTLLVNKVALMDKKKVIKILPPDETKLLNLLTNHAISSNYEIMTNGEIYELNIPTSKAKYKITASAPGKEVVRFKVRLDAVVEQKEDREEISKRVQKQIEQALNKKLSEELTGVLEKIRNAGTDPIGFGLRYYGRHWNNRTEEEQWKEIYPRIRFEVMVNTRVKSTGYSL